MIPRLPRSISLTAILIAAVLVPSSHGGGALDFQRSVIARGGTGWDYFQARTAYVPTDPPRAHTTVSILEKGVTHAYQDVFLLTSENHGETWTEPRKIPALRRFEDAEGYEVAAGDLWPVWHAASGTVLITGKTFSFAPGGRQDIFRESIAYASLDPESGTCGPLRTVDLPEADHTGAAFVAANAGCNQVVILPEGDILVPIRYQKQARIPNYTSTVLRCRYDGETLEYREHGSEHSLASGRGLYEPSAVAHQGAFFLTMRADDDAYVAKSADGLNYSDPVRWTFDDGEPLGSYNTQQHWATIGGRLYLVYTRRGAANDHIFRHRAPLFIAEVDPERLHVLRSTEQVVVPENGAILGNSGVCQISENEAWVTVGEGRLDDGRRQGEQNKVILTKITLR